MHYPVDFPVLYTEQESKKVKMGRFLKNSLLLLAALIAISSFTSSCSRRGYSGFRTDNRLISRPHKNWKQPKSRYPGRHKGKLAIHEKVFALSLIDPRY